LEEEHITFAMWTSGEIAVIDVEDGLAVEIIEIIDKIIAFLLTKTEKYQIE